MVGSKNKVSKMAVIYIVEDDHSLQTELARLLELNDYKVIICTDFSNAAKDILQQEPDLVILDLNLPDNDGLSICRDVRHGKTSKVLEDVVAEGAILDVAFGDSSDSSDARDVPIIVLTSSSDEFTEVMSLNLGAHDFVAKPYRPAVLLARIAALIKHHTASSIKGGVIEYAGVSLNATSSEVKYGTESDLLTRNEQRILALLMGNPETIISRQEIMCDLWESDAFVDDNTLTVNVNRLRKKLSEIGVPADFLQTRRSQGYIVTSRA